MSRGKSVWLKAAALSGILTPIVAFSCIALAIACYPPFSWTDNALSDLGFDKGISSVVFNSGLIISGILALVFASSLPKSLPNKTLARIGIFLFALDTIALTAIGVFPENIKPTHFYVSVAFFALFPPAMFAIGTVFLQTADTKMGLFSFFAAAFAIVVWAIQFTVGFGKNVAIPETLTALSVSAWAMILGFKMLKQ
jgi:hypothetical membrane protein